MTCAYRKLNPGVLMVQTSKNWAGNDAPSLRDSACDRRVLVQGYARHAISIDENRKNFQRVKWYSTKPTARDANGINWFEQVWFAGNHSDIGGSYCENESRLSDIALDWMLRWAVAIPDGL